MQAGASLNAGLLVGRNNEVILLQGGALPGAVIEVEETTSLEGEVGVAGGDPAAVLPRADGVLVEPAPDGGVADRGGDAVGAGRAAEVADAPAGQGAVVIRGRLAAEGADLHDNLRGEKARGRPGRGSSSRPARRRSKKPLRQRLTTSRRVLRRSAIRLLSRFWAARRIILARIT